MLSRALVVEDLNGLFGMEDDANLRSVYGVFEGSGGPGGAEYVATQLPGNIITSKFVQTDPVKAVEEGYLTTGNRLMVKNSVENTKYGVTGSLLLIQGTRLFLSWLGSSQVYVFKSDRTSIRDGNLSLRPLALTRVLLLLLLL